MSCCVVFCCDVLWCVVLSCVVLNCIVLCCIVLCCIMLCCFLLRCVVLCCVVLNCIVLCSTVDLLVYLPNYHFIVCLLSVFSVMIVVVFSTSIYENLYLSYFILFYLFSHYFFTSPSILSFPLLTIFIVFLFFFLFYLNYRFR